MMRMISVVMSGAFLQPSCVAGAWRVNPNGPEDSDFLARVAVEPLRYRPAGRELLLFLGCQSDGVPEVAVEQRRETKPIALGMCLSASWRRAEARQPVRRFG